MRVCDEIKLFSCDSGPFVSEKEEGSSLLVKFLLGYFIGGHQVNR